MARKQLRDKKSDNMSVLGESYRLSALPGDTAVYPCRLHDASLFERLRAFKRPRDYEEQYQSESLPKRFVSEEVVASHLQQLNLASSSTPPPSPVTTANTTPTTTDVLPSTQSPTCLSSTPLLSVPLFTSSDLLASAARSCPLSIKTVASCPRSLETNKDEMVYDDQICTDNVSDPLGRSIQSSSSSNYSTVVTSAQLIHSPDPLLVSRQPVSLLHSLDERMNSDETDGGVYQYMRTSPGHHKRPACVLDEESEESEERIEDAEGGGVFSAGPYTKRSKVDVRVTSASEFMGCDVLPLSLSLPHDQLQGMISDESSQCSSTDSSETCSGSSSGSKTQGTVVLEDGSDSSDGGQEPGPEKPLSLWLSPELQALSSSCGQESLLPPAILEKLHTPKGMELVPWVGGPSVLAKVEENQQQQLSTNGSDSPPMESFREETLAQESEQQPTSEDNLNDVSMEP